MRADRKRVAFFPAHPAQIWVLRPVAEEVSSFADVEWFLRDKDINRTLADQLGIEYRLVSRAGSGLAGNAREFLANIFRFASIGRRRKIDLWVTKYGACHISARLQGRMSLSFIDDDLELIPLMAWTSYPFVDEIVAPEVTRMGRWESKTVRFRGNFEISYLHPEKFKPDISIRSDMGLDDTTEFAIVRLSSLRAHHDSGIRGVAREVLMEVMDICGRAGIRVFITSERRLEEQLEPYRIAIGPERIHSALAEARFVLGDSQTMIQEAAVLGTPAVRMNDFVGRISIIGELERAGLAFGFRPEQKEDLLDTLEDLLSMSDWKDTFRARREALLSEWEDPAPLMVERIRQMVRGERVTS